jgi:hypothetical protein
MADFLKARLMPQPMATYAQPLPAGSARSAALARAYIHCTAGPTTAVFAPFAARARASGWDVRQMTTGHMAMLTVPHEVAELLLDVAGART